MTKPLVPQSDSKKNVIKVLIVDDIPETRENLKKLLAFEADIEVIGTASTGREGLDMAKELLPDIILMDINMPDMDGIAATEAINKAVPTASVVMMSVQSESDYLRRALQAGASDFLTKPISGEETQCLRPATAGRGSAGGRTGRDGEKADLDPEAGACHRGLQPAGRGWQDDCGDQRRGGTHARRHEGAADGLRSPVR
jgi:CheY-like chemotaxis protein